MRIVIVSDHNRTDFYNYIVYNLPDNYELFILWDYGKGSKDVQAFGGRLKFLYWKNYLTPRKFLEKVKPDRILFFEIIDFWQMPLIITCHYFNVPTFFIEHGVGNSVEMVQARFSELPSLKKRIFVYATKVIFGLTRMIRNRIFFTSAATYLSKEDKAKYFKMMVYYKMYTPIQALSQLKFRKRTPHFAILFNKNNIEPFLLYNEIEDHNIFTEGVPFFDKYFSQKRAVKDHLVFIEHPYLESNMLSWNDKFHESIARALEKFAITNSKRIVVKLHPRSDINNWLRYKLHSLVEIKQKEDITAEMLSAELVVGYSSTLINALIGCKKNIVLLGWHPKPQIQGDDFSKTGLCHVSFDTQDLFKKYETWLGNNLSINNNKAYHDFIKEYNYPFDGKATERVLKAILTNEIS